MRCSEPGRDDSVAIEPSRWLGNAGYDASLETRKIDVAIPDASASKHGLVRVRDESGDDYLYPSDFFASVELATAVRRPALNAA